MPPPYRPISAVKGYYNIKINDFKRKQPIFSENAGKTTLIAGNVKFQLKTNKNESKKAGKASESISPFSDTIFPLCSFQKRVAKKGR